jgi:hypothetical protein
MNKPAILGAALLGTLAYAIVSCNGSDNKTTNGTGGQGPGTGGSSSVDSGSPSGGDSGTSDECSDVGASPTFEDGGLFSIGGTDPSKGVTLAPGGFYAMPSTSYQGYCFTFADNFDPDGSTMYPPCGTTGPCFTDVSGLCPTANLGVATGSTIWGGGVGCNLNQKQGAGTYVFDSDVTGKTSITVSVFGCKVPAILRIQLNVRSMPSRDAAIPDSGYFCKDATLKRDTNGMMSGTVLIGDLIQDCWNGTGLKLDTATMKPTSIQVQLNSDTAKRTTFDFCISKMSID